MLDAAYLARFGTLEVPRELWRALGRFAEWVEPALIAEWRRPMRGYAGPQGRHLDEGKLGSAMTWSEPARDTALLSTATSASGDLDPRHRPLPAMDSLG